ncbi:MAG: hypothetical protein ACERKN_22095 [Velocimicrobium sp.]
MIYARSQKELDDKKAALKNGTYADDKGMTVGEWGWKWLKIYKSSQEDD